MKVRRDQNIKTQEISTQSIRNSIVIVKSTPQIDINSTFTTLENVKWGFLVIKPETNLWLILLQIKVSLKLQEQARVAGSLGGRAKRTT